MSLQTSTEVFKKVFTSVSHSFWFCSRSHGVGFISHNIYCELKHHRHDVNMYLCECSPWWHSGSYAEGSLCIFGAEITACHDSCDQLRCRMWPHYFYHLLLHPSVITKPPVGVRVGDANLSPDNFILKGFTVLQAVSTQDKASAKPT